MAQVTHLLEKVLNLKLVQHLPNSAMGEAISYARSLWPQLLGFRDDGRLEIDNNLIENAVRPTALGKKNWMFIGHPHAGQRSAMIYTLLECCKRRRGRLTDVAMPPRSRERDALSDAY